MTTTIATLKAVITADSTGFVRAMDGVRSSITGVEQQSNTLSQSMQKVGATMTAAITLPLLGIGAAAAKAATNFDASMRNINSIAHMSEEALTSLSAKVLEFGSHTRAGPEKTAEALYEVYSAGIMGQKAFDIMAIASKTAEAGLSNLSSTTKALTATVSAYSSMNLTAAEASNIWTRMVQVGVGSMEEFLSGAQRVLPSAANLGISFQNLGANIAYMSQQGGGAAMAETAVSMAMTNLMKPVKAMSAMFHQLGVQDAKGLIEKFGSLEEAIYALHKASGNEVDFAKMFSKSGLQYATTVVNNIDQLRASVKAFGVDLGNATASAWEEQMKSVAAMTDKFNSALQTLMITIGQQLLPIITPIVTKITEFLLALVKTNPEIVKFAVVFGIAAAAIGPLLLLLSALTSPITLLVAGVVALGYAFATNFAGIRDIVISTLSTISTLMAPAVDVIRAFWEVVTGQGVDLKTGLASNDLANSLNELLGGIGSTLNTNAVKPVQINIPIKAGMSLWSIYYGSEWSDKLQSQMSYDEFVKAASSQIKGGDPRWLQVGQTLSFNIPISMGMSPDERGEAQNPKTVVGKLVAPYKVQFLLLKDEIQRQYDYVFKGKPLFDAGGNDVSGSLPVLDNIKAAINLVKGVAENWGNTATAVLKDIGVGIGGFVKNLTAGIDWAAVQSIGNKIFVFLSVVGVAFNTGLQLILQVAGKVLGAALPVVGTVLKDFFNIILHLLDGGNAETLGKDLVQLGKDIISGIGSIADKLTGQNSGVSGLRQFADGITNAFIIVQYSFENGWRDLKLIINTGVFEVMNAFADAVTKLHDAKLIDDNTYKSFVLDLSKLRIDTDATGFAKAIETALTNGGKGMGTITINGADLRTALAFGSAQQIADNMTTVGKQNLLQAIKTALTNGDKDGVLAVSLPIAVAAGLDVGKLDYSKLGTDTKEAIRKALATTSTDANGQNMLPTLTGVGADIVAGFTEEIEQNAPNVYGALTVMSDEMKATVEKQLEIQSPSKWAGRMSGFIISGFIAGFIVGTLLLAVASGLMALMGIKMPLQNALSYAEGNRISTTFVSGLTAAITTATPALLTATGGVSGAFQTMTSVILSSGYGLATKMQDIVNQVTGQLNALKSAVQSAANITVPGSPPPKNGGTVVDAGRNASGGVADGWSWVGERGPELVNFDQQGSVVTSRAIRDVVSGGATSNSSNQTNNVVINGVQDVDKMLFELRRRGIKLS